MDYSGRFKGQGVSRSNGLVLNLLLGITYYLLARLGLLLAFEQSNATAVWPPSGIALAALLIFGLRLVPGIFLGAFSANFAIFSANIPQHSLSILLGSSAISLGNTLEAVVGYYLVHRFLSGKEVLANVTSVMRFFVITLMVCMISATVGAISVITCTALPWSAFGTAWATWWGGDILGILVLSPFLMVLGTTSREAWRAISLREFAIYYGLLIATCVLGFGSYFDSQVSQSFSYLVLPFVIWSVFRFPVLVTCFSILTVATISILGTVQGNGPLRTDQLNESLLLLHLFVGTIALVSYALVAAVNERNYKHKLLEQANWHLEAKARELGHMNDELDAFSYSVSHDLKAPLRRIHEFADLLVQDYRKYLDEQGGHYAERIKIIAGEAQDLINSLIMLARSSREVLQREHKDLGEIAKKVIEELKSQDPQREVNIRVQDGLYAYIDEKQFRIVLENLLSNAWKYTARKKDADIEVGLVGEMPSAFFYIRDNGVGFDNAYQDKLFIPFQRLHTDKEFEGSGIGLSLVQRVIHRHGGTIWAESNEGEGATFYFSVPQDA